MWLALLMLTFGLFSGFTTISWIAWIILCICWLDTQT